MKPWEDWQDTWRDQHPVYLPVVSRSLRPVASPADDDPLDDDWFIEEGRETKIEPLSRPVFEAWMGRLRRTIVVSAILVATTAAVTGWLTRP